MRMVLAALVCLCEGGASHEQQARLANLDRERDPARLEAAAIAFAASHDSATINGLAKRLGDRAFLNRLDPPVGLNVPVVRLGRVLRVWAENPSDAMASAAVKLAHDRDYSATPARLNPLLTALAAVRPMTENVVRVFRETSYAGFLEVNGPLLARNGSQRALSLLGDLLRADALDVAQRISMAHWALVPTRTDPQVIALCARLSTAHMVTPELDVAILESLFDYQPRTWFGRDAALAFARVVAWRRRERIVGTGELGGLRDLPCLCGKRVEPHRVPDGRGEAER